LRAGARRVLFRPRRSRAVDDPLADQVPSDSEGVDKPSCSATTAAEPPIPRIVIPRKRGSSAFTVLDAA
jgi:hypothetical protein